MFDPPLAASASGRSPSQAAGSFIADPTRPQALIQHRQRLAYELWLRKLVILSRSAPRSAMGDWAVARSRRRHSEYSSAFQNGPGPRHHATFCYTSHLRAGNVACRAALAYAPKCPLHPRPMQVALSM